MDGFDYEIGVCAPYLPSSRFYVGGYNWDGSSYDIGSGVLALTNYVNNRISVDLGVEDNDHSLVQSDR